MRNSLALLAIFLFASAGCGKNGSDSSSTPGSRGPNDLPYPEVQPNGEIRGEGNFATLIKRASQGKPRAAPWAGYWWPYESNGIEQSASKYDRARGSVNAVSWEVSKHGTGAPGLQSWFGHCNGWAAASILYQEPRQPAEAGGVSFSVTDQKALLSEAAMEVSADFFGMRNDDNNPSSLSFQDVAPNVFFLVLTNYVGSGLGLAIDRYTGNQVWNHPVAGYRIAPVRQEDYLGPSPGAPDVHRVLVTSTVWWVRDDVEGGHLTEPFEFSDGASYQSRTFRYEVWMDAPPSFDGSGNLQGAGRVIVARQGNTAIGGAWRNGNLDLLNSHPDYIWVPHSVSASSGYSNPYVDARYLEQSFGRRNPN